MPPWDLAWQKVDQPQGPAPLRPRLGRLSFRALGTDLVIPATTSPFTSIGQTAHSMTDGFPEHSGRLSGDFAGDRAASFRCRINARTRSALTGMIFQLSPKAGKSFSQLRDYPIL